MSKELFKKIFTERIHREGAKELLAWLETTDFFTAPASTKYHGAYEGGLVDHSLNVYKLFRQELLQRLQLFADKKGETLTPELEEFCAVCALLHDVCKVQFYTQTVKNQKNSKGDWEQVPYYTVNDQFSYGHGEKSVWLVQRFIRLSVEESIAIRWHMGGFDDAVRGGSRCLSKAWNDYPSAMLLHVADMKATYMLDK